MQIVTLVFLKTDDQILLAMKKRGFGAGKWNGAGGKIEPNETLIQAAIRECQEEIHVTPIRLEKVAVLDFYLDDFPQQGHVYICEEWTGEPKESEEMKPAWYSIDQIPYPDMWEDDEYWLPLVLEGKKVEGEFTFKNDTMLTHSVRVVDKL